ncbi:thioesterase II family protein [Streptomyces wuyuanensis]|uniref:thioesterase II family protein n=1 Tax=Streptomyces wuyuanensis TaxID=1196353 RepID=UPI0037199FA1
MKLYCLPYAGCSARVFNSWQALLPDSVDVIPLELPGRGVRCIEEPISELSALLDDLIELTADAWSTPYAIFGHSYGAVIAFEVARLMSARGFPAPLALIVSACRAPGLLEGGEVIHTLSDDEFRDRLAVLRGTPRELLEDDELMELYIPIIRADYKILDEYRLDDARRLDCPITAFCGSNDRDADLASMEAWSKYTTQAFDIAHVNGDHFFLHSSERDVVAQVALVCKRVGGIN